MMQAKDKEDTTMRMTMENLDELMGFAISEDSFFSEGTVIMIDGSAWELIEMVGSDLIFETSDDLEAAQENNKFFYDRSN